MVPLRPCLLILVATLPAAGQITPTIYADIELKQQGNPAPIYFTIRLDRPVAPRTVVNFLGLATGLRPWVDPVTGVPSSEPFFDGLEVPEVIANERVYFGSPTNDGHGGPGYVVQDESLGTGNGIYYVYMDNESQPTRAKPNTNGSRFFVSIPSQALNDRYTRLGFVDNDNAIQALNSRYIINQLSKVATDANGKPSSTITIKNIEIRGWAPDDGTLPLDTWNLPEVSAAGFRIRREGNNYRLLWSDEPGSAAYYFGSPDLVNWFPYEGFDPPGASSLGVDITSDVANVPHGFYRGSAIHYPKWPAAEFETRNTALQFNYIDDLADEDPLTNELVLIKFEFGATGVGGTWTKKVDGVPHSSGTLIATWSATQPFVGELTTAPVGGLPAYTYRLHFDYHYPVPPIPVHRFDAFLPVYPFTGFSGRWTRTALAP